VKSSAALPGLSIPEALPLWSTMIASSRRPGTARSGRPSASRIMTSAALFLSESPRNSSAAATPSYASNRIATACGSKFRLSLSMRFKGTGVACCFQGGSARISQPSAPREDPGR
jgi:hypothetical protein